jgi:predicted DNA-binding transcriptional regulator YafY
MKNRSYDKKIFRLVSILNKLDTKGKVKTSELAKEFNVSVRSIQRDLELLNMTGFPLVMVDKGTHAFMEGFSLRKLTLSQKEASLLSILYEMSKELGKDFQDSFKDILQKVLQNNESSFYIKMPAKTKENTNIPFVKELNLAIAECRQVELYYLKDGKEKWFKVNPLKIAFFEGFWYLVSEINNKHWIIKFRLDKIKELKALDQTFEPPENIKTILDQSINIWFSEKRDKKIKLRINKEVAHFFKERQYFPLQRIVKENKDGALIIECTACEYQEVIPTILKWIPYIKVVKPNELHNKTIKRIEMYKRREDAQ